MLNISMHDLGVYKDASKTLICKEQLTYTPRGIILLLLDKFIYINKLAKSGPSSMEDRINRIEGQLRGIAKMINEEEEIEKVIIQIKAVSSSIESLKLELVKSQIKKKMMIEMDTVINMIK